LGVWFDVSVVCPCQFAPAIVYGEEAITTSASVFDIVPLVPNKGEPHDIDREEGKKDRYNAESLSHPTPRLIIALT
jgi:hypothetical protein